MTNTELTLDQLQTINGGRVLGSTSGPGGSTFMTGQFEMPTDNLGGSSDPGGDDI